jgi:uncharacterized 2Fe-2S/4Fe-4S cluster protein (DUF4445 family)
VEGYDLFVDTIGGVPAVGMCGSGLIDLVAALLETGVVDHTGLMHPDAPHPLGRRVVDRNGLHAFEGAEGVILTQKDIRQVQLASAAIATGIDLLLDAAGIDRSEVTEVVFGGGFGFHVRAGALCRMGMIPAQWCDRVTYAGNTAMAGATRALLDRGQRRLAEAIAHHVETIDLGSDPRFQQRFIECLDFPRG